MKYLIIFDSEKKFCDTCLYFRQYYIKSKTYFRKAGCGHCIKKRFNGNYVEKVCALYTETDRASEKEEQLKSLTEYLSSVNKRLNELKQVLKEK